MSAQMRRRKHVLLIVLVLVMFFAMSAVASAQTATPVPPTVIPDIEIPTGDMVTNLNQWIEVLAPIVLFVGMIPVALALLNYIVHLFQQAFRG